MATHAYDFGKPEDIDDFRRIIGRALAETIARSEAPRLYKASGSLIEPVSSSELADMIAHALRREVSGKNYYGRRAA